MTTSAPPQAPASGPGRKLVTPWSMLIPVIGLLAGMIFAGSSSVATTGGRTGAVSLTDLITQDTSVNSERTRQLVALRAEVDALEAANATGDDQTAKLRAAGNPLAAASGLTAVHGPALTVSLDDSPLRGDQIPKGMTVNDVVVHQQDVQAVVNALWHGGAEAMMLMDQRVINTSAVRCVGNTLILQGQVYSPPFVITAIGDTAAMKAALDTDVSVGTYRQYVAAAGLGYDVKRLADVTFPAFSGSTGLTYARIAS
ncbi:MAG: DUF881 domain-containing protein [Nostocoides sp.]